MRLEQLETRDLLSGVVTIAIGAGSLTLTGDTASNSIQLRADAAVPTNFLVTGLSGTQLQVAGNPVTSPFTAVGITANVTVALGNGNDSFDFQGPTGGGSSNVLGNLVVANGNGADTTTLNNVTVAGASGIVITNTGQATNTLTNVSVTGDSLVITTGAGAATSTLTQVAVNGGLTVAEGGAGDRSLTLSNCTIQGTTVVATGGGNSTTMISNSALLASLGGTALTVATGATPGAQATVTVLDAAGPASTFGAGAFAPPAPFGPPPPPLPPAIIVSNPGAGAGGTTTQLIGQSPTAPVVVFGGVTVANAATQSPANLNITSFSNANVLGATIVTNGSSATQTLVTNSKLGTQLSQGGPLTVLNSTGADQFSMSGNSSVPFGILINNAGGGPAATFGSTTTITTGASIGTRPAGPAVPGQAGIALAVSGDAGVDTVSIAGATFGAGINLGGTFGQIGLGNGNNVVSIAGTTINNGGLDLTLGQA